MSKADELCVGIIGGAGTLGSAMAFYLASRNALREVVLLDVKENVVRAHTMDMEQAMVPISDTQITHGSVEDLQRCKIVVVTASVHELNATDRLQFLHANVPIVSQVSEQIKSACPDAIIINATNPADVFNYMLWKQTQLRSEQFIGFSINDSVRFRWAISRVVGISPQRVDALVIGEHGPAQVLLFSTVRIDGERVELSDEQRAQASELVYSWFGKYTSLKSGRTSGWTSAVSVWRVIQQILEGSATPISLSVIPDGDYGLRDLSIGLPVLLSSAGVGSIVSLDLEDSEQEGLQKAANLIKEQIGSIDT